MTAVTDSGHWSAENDRLQVVEAVCKHQDEVAERVGSRRS